MQGSKVRNMLPVVAGDLSLPLETVEAVNNFFWQNVRKALADAPKLTVHLPNLGDFIFKHWKLKDELASKELILQRVQQKPNPNAFLVDDLNDRIDQCKRLMNMKVAEDQRKEFIKNFKANKQSNVSANITTDLEE